MDPLVEREGAAEDPGIRPVPESSKVLSARDVAVFVRIVVEKRGETIGAAGLECAHVF